MCSIFLLCALHFFKLCALLSRFMYFLYLVFLVLQVVSDILVYCFGDVPLYGTLSSNRRNFVYLAANKIGMISGTLDLVANGIAYSLFLFVSVVFYY